MEYATIWASVDTFYNSHSKYAKLELNKNKPNKDLEFENNRLTKLLSEKILENGAMKVFLSIQW